MHIHDDSSAWRGYLPVGPLRPQPLVTQQRLDELERILARWVARRRAMDERQHLARLRAILGEDQA